jgi:hypothetical protein
MGSNQNACESRAWPGPRFYRNLDSIYKLSPAGSIVAAASTARLAPPLRANPGPSRFLASNPALLNLARAARTRGLE